MSLSTKKSVFISFVFFLNTINSILIILCLLLSNYYLPNFSTLSFLTFFLPIFFIFNLVFLIYWILKFNLKLILPLTIILLLGYNSVSFYNLGNVKNNSDGLHVMSFNVRLFNHYKWINNDYIPQEIQNFIYKQDPNILAIQEYHYDYEYILKKYKNKHVFLTGKNVGLAIYTNNKLINKGSVEFKDSGNVAIFIDFLQNGDTLRLYNAHFESFKVDVIGLKADVKSIKEIVFKTKNTFLAQKIQSSVLIKHMDESPYPVVLAADLNNTQYSFIYKQFQNNFNDSFRSNGNGFGSTYDFKFMPIRIDYLFNSRTINVNNFKIYSEILSDHRPISVFLDI